MVNPGEAVQFPIGRGTTPALKAIMGKAAAITGTKDKEPPPQDSPVYETLQQQRRDIGALASLIAELTSSLSKQAGLAGTDDPRGSRGFEGQGGKKGDKGDPGPPGEDCDCFGPFGGPFPIRGTGTLPDGFGLADFKPLSAAPNFIWEPEEMDEPENLFLPRYTEGLPATRNLPAQVWPARIHYLYDDGVYPRIYVGDNLGVAPWYPSAWQVATGRFGREPAPLAITIGPAVEEGITWLTNLAAIPSLWDGTPRHFQLTAAASAVTIMRFSFQYGDPGSVGSGVYLKCSQVGVQHAGPACPFLGFVVSVTVTRVSGTVGAGVEVYKSNGTVETLLGTVNLVGSATVVVLGNLLWAFGSGDRIAVKTLATGSSNDMVVNVECAGGL